MKLIAEEVEHPAPNQAARKCPGQASNPGGLCFPHYDMALSWPPVSQPLASPPLSSFLLSPLSSPPHSARPQMLHSSGSSCVTFFWRPILTLVT